MFENLSKINDVVYYIRAYEDFTFSIKKGTVTRINIEIDENNTNITYFLDNYDRINANKCYKSLDSLCNCKEEILSKIISNFNEAFK